MDDPYVSFNFYRFTNINIKSGGILESEYDQIYKIKLIKNVPTVSNKGSRYTDPPKTCQK